MKKKVVSGMLVLSMTFSVLAGGGMSASASEGEEKYPEFLTIDVFDSVSNYQGLQSGWFAELVKEKRIDGITYIGDESSREGMRINIELRKDANANVILNQLYKHTQLQDTYGVIMLALVGKEPKVLNLLDMLKYYLLHQEDVVTRRTKYDLNKAEERAHILKGLLIALDNIDEVIRIIRGSQSTPEAKQKLMERFGLDDVQAQAIVDMRSGTGEAGGRV